MYWYIYRKWHISGDNSLSSSSVKLLYSNNVTYSRSVTITAQEDIKLGVISISASHDNSVPSGYSGSSTSGTITKYASNGNRVFSGCTGELFLIENVTSGSTITLDRGNTNANVTFVYLLKIH